MFRLTPRTVVVCERLRTWGYAGRPLGPCADYARGRDQSCGARPSADIGQSGVGWQRGGTNHELSERAQWTPNFRSCSQVIGAEMNVEKLAQTAVRRYAHLLPGIYNYRTRHNSWIQRARGGIHEADFQILASLDTPKPAVLDVGANTGQTIMSIKSMFPRASITSLEPSPGMLGTLNRVASKYPDVRILPVGASREFSIKELYTPIVRGLVLTQYASVVPVSPTTVVDQMAHDGFRSGPASEVVVRTESCVFVPLDLVADTCDVLKVDVEGHEEAVLAGASALLERSHPILIVERPSPVLEEHITSLGYRRVTTQASENCTFVHPDFARGVPLG